MTRKSPTTSTTTPKSTSRLSTPTDQPTRIQTYLVRGPFWADCEACGARVRRNSAAMKVHEASAQHQEALAKIEHPDTDEHRAGCTRCQYVYDSKLPDNADISERHRQTRQPLAAFTPEQPSKTWTAPASDNHFNGYCPTCGQGCGCESCIEPQAKRAARALELLKVIADFWGSDQCDAPIFPGAYLTDEDEAIRFVIWDFVYPAPRS